MAFTTTVSSRGGAKMKAVLAKAEQNRRKKIKVGFFSAAPSMMTGRAVAKQVAAIQEALRFGAPAVPASLSAHSSGSPSPSWRRNCPA